MNYSVNHTHKLSHLYNVSFTCAAYLNMLGHQSRSVSYFLNMIAVSQTASRLWLWCHNTWRFSCLRLVQLISRQFTSSALLGSFSPFQTQDSVVQKVEYIILLLRSLKFQIWYKLIPLSALLAPFRGSTGQELTTNRRLEPMPDGNGC